ncbi:MAG: GNAT family N-acetyltransferase [Clostridia bacterium]|nr:GNAT family N-acetyltransferase [Clostridia bacterium]
MKTIFESDNILFTEVSERLVRDYLAMVNDVENVGWPIGHKTEQYTEEQELRWVRKKREENAVVFSMIEKRSGAFIGNIELMDVRDGQGELGIAITAGKQDRGFGTEAITALAAYGADRLGLRRIVLRAYPDNARAIHVYEKCGFREYDRTEETVFMELRREGVDFRANRDGRHPHE